MKRKKLRIFLDSNVLLSGLFSPTGPPRLILDILCLDLPVLSGLTGRYNIIEIERNLIKKIPAALNTYKAFLTKLKLEVIPLPAQKDIKRLSGVTSNKDIPVLASPINGNADYLVTGDRGLYLSARGKHKLPLKIVAPAEFLELILPELLKSLENK